jgi:glycosyltransferase involved in cell wall biosynthesis
MSELRILVLSSTLPPAPSAATTVLTNLCRQFGPEEMVLAGYRPVAQTVEASQGLLPQPVHFIARRHRRSRLDRWKRWLDIPFVSRRAARLVKQYDCNALMCIHPYEQLLVAASRAARKANVPFYPWLLNTWLESGGTHMPRLAAWLQPRVFASARHVFVMSDGMAEFYRKQYPGLSVSPLRHCLSTEIPPYETPPEPRTPAQLIICGNTTSCLDAALRVRDTVEASDDLELTFLSPRSRESLARQGLLGARTDYDSVPLEEVTNRLNQADIVVLPHGLTGPMGEVEYQTIFPTKTIECLLSRRPIVAHSPENCFLTRYLRAHDAAVVVTEPDPARLKAAIDEVRTDAALRERLVKNALKTAEMFRPERVAAHLRETLQGG